MHQGFPASAVQDDSIKYADDNARESWEISEKISKIAQSLPPEGHPLNLRRIGFDSKVKRAGLNAVFAAGKVVSAGNGISVPERTCKILDSLDIDYQIFSNGN